MVDGVTSSSLPAGYDLYAGYVDGRYAWSAADWARWASKRLVRIAVSTSTNDGHVLDVEPGNDMTPSHWVAWVQMRRRSGAQPGIYMNASTWPSVQQAFRSAGVAEPWYWVAHWGVQAVIPGGAAGLQYESTPGYDVSVMADYIPGVDPAPVDQPPPGGSSGPASSAGPPPPMEDELAFLVMTTPPVRATPTLAGTDYALVSGDLFLPFASGDYSSAVALARKLGDAVPVSNAFWSQLAMASGNTSAGTAGG